MEKVAESLSPDFKTMDESLQFIFGDMVNQGEMLDAVEFIRSIDEQFLPSVSIMRTLIFEILMKNECTRTLAYTADYLQSVIDSFPPSNEERRRFYFDSIRDNHGFLADLWTVFSHIVKSFFIQRDIYLFEKEGSSSDPIKYPNCKFLLNFYLKLFMVDFKHYKSDGSATCIVMELFWPNSEVRTIYLSTRTELLLKWLNDIYASASVNDMGDLLESMHEMLTLVVKCIIEGRDNLSEYAAFNSASLAEIVDYIVNFCKDGFSKLSNVKKFLSFLTLNYLLAKLCEKIIKQIIKVSSRKYSVLLLKDIVEQCMFPSKLSKQKSNTKFLVKEKKELRKRWVDKKYFADMKMESTKLHELCRKNRFADLFEELNSSSSEDINARDTAGNTPLHEACSVGSRLCVRHLIDHGCSGVTQTLDFAAFNLEGITALHIAIMNDFVDIARMLLSHGGTELLTMPDIKGQLPTDLSTSDSMNKLIQEFEAKLKDSAESDSLKDRSNENHGPVPILRNFKEYSIYLHALNCLLCTYCDMFNLYDYIWLKDIMVSSHNYKACCHFTGKDVCSEDAVIISEISLLVDTFMESIAKNAAKFELNIDIELIPLKGFVASLQTF